MADELLAVRRAKLDKLRADGIDPFPHEFPGVEPTAGVLAAHADLADGQETAATPRVAARLRAPRAAPGGGRPRPPRRPARGAEPPRPPPCRGPARRPPRPGQDGVPGPRR